MTYTAASRIIGTPRVSPFVVGRMLASVMLRQETPRYTRDDVQISIVPAYFALCRAVEVDPLVALAQMCHETGWLSSAWCARPRRNPAGIGVNGQPGAGVSFATWADDAIPAHIGRLLAYALPAGLGSTRQQALIIKALGYRPFPHDRRGVAPTLGDLNGRWAVPGTDYADKLAQIANQFAGAQ